MNAHVIRLVRLIRLDGRFCLHEIDVLPDFLRAHVLTIYADQCTLSQAELERWHITFKKIRRDISKL